jgi:RimJ/RimL family protein N-acetyltransferase
MRSAADVELRDGDVVVRGWLDRDADAVGVTPRDPEIGEFFGEPFGGLPDPDPDAPAFAVVEAGAPVGRVWFAPWKRPPEVGYYLRRDAWGRGLATRSLRLVCEWLAEQGEERVELLVHPRNERSQAVAARAGFVSAGEVAEYARFKDGTTRALRFERRLAP